MPFLTANAPKSAPKGAAANTMGMAMTAPDLNSSLVNCNVSLQSQNSSPVVMKFHLNFCDRDNQMS
jgi:hypothetical protein